ncbi:MULTISPECIES: acetate uptake transporter [unclassified Nocardioides]|uniref:acetate uptake transporter n=1 Tax=Nocardioides sp. URHA0032 TaxID=1380388 RepID=UPI000561DAB0|nr:acetate uptake transporter family protein [Nocardioides sp. URHA0032]
MTTTQEASQEASPVPVRGPYIADPAPLGLAAFALTTFVLSFVNTGLFKVEPVVFGLALAYGGIAQFAAGMWEFAKGNTFGATAFASYGAFWVSFWWLTGHTDLTGSPEGDVSNTVGLYLLAWGIFTAYMTIAATRVSGAVLAVFVLLTITFLLLAIGDFATSETISKIGGWCGVATALAAWYASLAGVTAFTHKRQVFPVATR